MNDDAIQDLKQFIAVTISQQTSDIIGRLDGIDVRLDSVEGKIDELSKSVAEALDTTNDVTDTQLKDHEERIMALEHKAA